jgi:hypothetical protein
MVQTILRWTSPNVAYSPLETIEQNHQTQKDLIIWGEEDMIL